MTRFTRRPPCAHHETRTGTTVVVPLLMHWAWSPLGLFLMLPLPTFIASLLISPESFASLWGQPALITAVLGTTLTIFMGAIAFIFLLSAPTYLGRGEMVLTEARVHWLGRSVRLLTVITILAYVVWLVSAATRGLNLPLLASALSGEPGLMSALQRRYLEPIPGVTTWMHLGVLLAPLLILRKRAGGPTGTVLLSTLFALALFRSVFFSERLALIEIAVSTAVAALTLRSEPPPFLRTVPRAVTTLIGSWAALIGFFTALEFNRSWINFYAERYNGGVLQFAAERLVGYYATAINNGILYTEASPPNMNLAALIPGLSEIPLFSASERFHDYQRLLAQGSNPEFNNISGLTVPLAILGPVLGLVFFALLAVVFVVLASAVRRGAPAALALYSVSAVGILELVRIYHFSSSRFLVVLVGVLAIWLTLPSISREAPRPRRNRQSPPALSRSGR